MIEYGRLECQNVTSIRKEEETQRITTRERQNNPRRYLLETNPNCRLKNEKQGEKIPPVLVIATKI
jgi:hypothetical protein